MNYAIILCLCALIIIMLAMTFSRSQSLQRFGVIEFSLVLAVGGSALFGYMQAQQLTTDQYFQLFSVHFGGAYAYINELEQCDEYDDSAKKQKLGELEKLLNDILPVTYTEDESYRYVNAVVLERDETDNYRQCWFSGENTMFWQDVSEQAMELINQSIRDKAVAYDKLTNSRGILVLTDNSMIAPKYAIVTEISLAPLEVKLQSLRHRYFVYGFLILIVGTVLVAGIIFLQGREMRRIIRMISRVAEGKDDWESLQIERRGFGVESNEMRSLYNSLRQIVSDVKRINYMKYKILQAYYRFAPKEIEKILNKQSILDVEPSDRVSIEGTLAFVSFSISESIAEQEYLKCMNRNYSLLGDVRKEYEGIMISGNSDLSILKLMFKEETKKALHFGIELVMREDIRQQISKTFVLLHRASFVYGVAGDEEQTFSYIHSKEMKILEQYVDGLRSMGIRMAVTDYVYEVISNEAAVRYIGFIEDGNYNFKIYEVLDAYPAKERLSRIELAPKFQKAMSLFYEGDFYLARNTFSEVLKDCPTDEVSKWYIFLCEKCLNGENTDRQIFSLFS